MARRASGGGSARDFEHPAIGWSRNSHRKLGEATRVRLFDFIEKSNQAQSPDDVFDLFRQAMAEYGYDRIAFAATTQQAQATLARQDLKPVVALNFPTDWVHHYFTHNYQDIDPIIQLSPHTQAALDWEHLLKHGQLTSKQARLMLESREAGLHNGISIPIHGPRGESYVASLATETPARDGPRDLNGIQLAAIQFHLAYARVSEQHGAKVEPIRLTDRERECLTWTARGKSAWAISMILGVSEHTVNFHLKSVMRKLKAGNRIQAVALAVRLGLVTP
ncbi:MAG: LuxR family transcriptional regulator [Rhodospirillales bacterium]|nr:LuxR family transcriptional regulator [Rhodospirillales bacterium]